MHLSHNCPFLGQILAAEWGLLLLAFSDASPAEKPRDLLTADDHAKSRFSKAIPSKTSIPITIWVEGLARNDQVILITSGPQTEPMRLPRLESALAAPIVSREPTLMRRV